MYIKSLEQHVLPLEMSMQFFHMICRTQYKVMAVEKEDWYEYIHCTDAFHWHTVFSVSASIFILIVTITDYFMHSKVVL